MADNLTLPATSSVISTDEVTRSSTTQHVQYIKIMDGTDGSAAVITGDATYGLDVDVTRLPKGTKSIYRMSITAGGNTASVAAANTSRKSLTIFNSSAVTVYLGTTSGVSTTQGFILPVNAVLTDRDSTDAWYFTASAAAELCVIEVT